MIALINHQGLKVIRGIQLQSPSPPIGLAYIGAFLRKHGHDYTAIDACGAALDQIRGYQGSDNILVQGLTVEEVVARVPEDVQIIGFTCLFSHCWPLVVRMGKALRERFPNALFVVGGEHGTAAPETVLDDARIFDVVVNGEGEETILELVTRHKAGRAWKDIDGITHRLDDGRLHTNRARKRVTDLNSFPWPDWDSWCIEAYIEKGQVTGINLGRQMPILGSRGCPYDCKFCSNDGMWTRKYIMREPARLVDEMEEMKKRYRVSGFTFMDSTFVVNRAKTLAFARDLIARRLDITYQLPAGTRCEAFDEELAHALDESGLKNFAFAPESGSKEILKAIRKRVDLDKLIEAMRVVLQTNMTVGCFIVIGFPEDSPESMKATLALVRRMALLGTHDVTVSKFTPYPGSDYFRELQASGRLSHDLQELANVIDFYSSEGKSYCDALTDQQLYRWMMWMYLNFYVISFARRPARVARNLMGLLATGTENTRYMRLLSELLFNRRRWKTSAVATEG